jgi:DNA-binding NtrC family response regulator
VPSGTLTPIPSPLSPPLIGAPVASRYAIARKLGAGSLGAVDLARDSRTGRLVPLKVLGSDRLGSSGVARLLPRAHAPARAPVDSDRLSGGDLEELKRELEREYFMRLFCDCRGDLGAMREKLGVKRSCLYLLLKRVGLDVR